MKRLVLCLLLIDLALVTLALGIPACAHETTRHTSPMLVARTISFLSPLPFSSVGFSLRQRKNTPRPPIS